MHPDRWNEIQGLFAEFRILEPEERSGRLDEILATDPELHGELESLLSAHDRADELLGDFESLISEPSFEPAEEPGAAPAPVAPSSDPHGLIGRTVSHYEVLELLGSGGMGVLYKAVDVQLDRTVALKFLPPMWGLDEGLKERFQREARAAAALDHANVCNIHEIGETEDGQLFISMAFYEGETVAEKIARGPLEVSEAMRLARQAANGLAAAHRAGLVHRDIKPANLLVTNEGVLKILDFGLAQTDETALTKSGMLLGTPAYMSPEQTRGEELDESTDLWSLGVVLYEMLTGRHPFRRADSSPVILIHAIQNEDPEPPSGSRPDLLPDVQRLVLGLLDKEPSGRHRAAEQLADELAGAYPHTGVSKSALTGKGRVSTPWLVLGGYALASWFAIRYVEPLWTRSALPAWLGRTLLVSVALGFAVLLLTALAQPVARMTKSRSAAGIARLFTLRNDAVGAVVMTLLLTTTLAGYIAMRALGIGAPATLIAQGRLADRTEVVLADFQNETRDTLLGPALDRALRIDLWQSPVVRVVASERVAAVLKRMGVEPEAKLDLALAREVAFREQFGAVLAPAIGRVGPGYVITAELLTADGDPLLSARETATDSTEILVALDRLSKGLRERIGEPLRSIASSTYVPPSTTSNLDALKKLVAAGRVWYTRDPDSLKLIEEAIALDSTYVGAWFFYGGSLMNMAGERARGVEALTRAFELRNRVTDRERYYIEGTYYHLVTREEEKAIQAFRDYLELVGDDTATGPIGALNHLGIIYADLGQFARAEATFREAVKRDSVNGFPLGDYEHPRTNLSRAQVNLGKYDEARRTLLAPVARSEAAGEEMPASWNYYLGRLASATGDYETAEEHFVALREGLPDNPSWRLRATDGLVAVLALRGQLGDARELRDATLAAFEEHGLGSSYVVWAILRAGWSLHILADTAGALATVEAALARFPWDEIDDPPNHTLTRFLAQAGDTEWARATLEEQERDFEDTGPHSLERGEIALADGYYEEAVATLREADVGWAQAHGVNSCVICALPALARAYDRADQADSAIATYERYASTPYSERVYQDQYFLAAAHERLGQLYDERGDYENALLNYAKFVELWRDADPELQPRVQAAQARLEAILAERG